MRQWSTPRYVSIRFSLASLHFACFNILAYKWYFDRIEEIVIVYIRHFCLRLQHYVYIDLYVYVSGKQCPQGPIQFF